MRKRSNKEWFSLILTGFILSIAVYAFFLTLYYVVVISKGYFNSDIADTILWANASIESGNLISKTFAYACILPFGGNLIMLPFVAIFGLSMKAQTMGMVTFLLIFVLALIYLARGLKWGLRWTGALVSSVLFVIMSSTKLREMFLQHIIYYSLGILFLIVGFNIVIRYLNKEKFINKYIIIIFIWTIICSTNGFTLFTIYNLPIIGGLVGLIFFDYKIKISEKTNLKRLFAAGSLVVGSLIGIIIGKALIGQVVANYSKAYSTFSESDKWIENFQKLFVSIFTLMGVDVKGSDLLYDKAGVINLLRILCTVIIFISPIVMTFFYNKIKEDSYKIILISHHILSILIILGWTFGKLNSANWRLSPLVVSTIIVNVIFAKWILDNVNVKRMVAIIAVPVILISLISINTVVKLPKQTEGNKSLCELTDFLISKDLKYGYSSFWNANSINIMSEGKVRIGCIEYINDTVLIRKYQSDNRWYKNVAGCKKYFIALTKTEADEYFNENNILPKPIEEYSVGNYLVLVYDYNVANDF